jgi:hypothetical protein
MKLNRYTFGYTDYHAIYGEPFIEWQPIKASNKYKYSLAACYVGLALSMSMVVAPMAWVKLFMWALS